MIYPYSFTCRRDGDLAAMLADSLYAKHRPEWLADLCIFAESGDLVGEPLARISRYTKSFINRPPGWGNGAGWNGFEMKIAGLGQLVTRYGVKDDDWLVHLDSDVVLLKHDPFVELMSCDAELAGVIQGLAQDANGHWKPMPRSQAITSHLGTWGHASGGFLCLKGVIVKKVLELTERQRLAYQDELFVDDICQNEDVSLSYIASRLGARQYPLNAHQALDHMLHFQELCEGKTPTKSFAHLNIHEKWTLPSQLRAQGLYPWT